MFSDVFEKGLLSTFWMINIDSVYLNVLKREEIKPFTSKETLSTLDLQFQI